MQFFFDYTTSYRSLRDYQGHEFSNFEAAGDFAEATAQTLRNNLNDDWKDWLVEVRNAEGTKYFSLPVTPGRQVAVSANVGSLQAVTNRSSLLIIEDTATDSAIISHIASKVGFATAKAHSYEDACEILARQQFDCITLDLELGGHFGLYVLRYLATIQCKAQIIVISQSDREVRDDVADLGRALDLSVWESVSKPFDLDALRLTLVACWAQITVKKAGLIRSDPFQPGVVTEGRKSELGQEPRRIFRA
jgi:CheY-like chemotaxis protein